ncbi:unnamed protein product [Rotaria sordida]|uniref:Uncharacterized protein n=1 Tax=Rotaria sordida TaxID=392033 RepID=A0A818SI55_9BILA|nr:unnamed protein product [Rotaria sordida]CAF3669390.1 unnamed protein product [Rotaria sordida]CAF3878893.1 unnamed protein product [Rotaria sordida]
MVTSDNLLLVNPQLPFTLKTQLNKNQQNEVDLSHEQKIDNKSEFSDVIQIEINLNSNFGRLLCGSVFYQGFEKAHVIIISEKHELVNSIFTIDSNKFNFDQILASLIISIIEHEFDRGAIQFPSSKQLVKQITNVIEKEKI